MRKLAYLIAIVGVILSSCTKEEEIMVGAQRENEKEKEIAFIPFELTVADSTEEVVFKGIQASFTEDREGAMIELKAVLDTQEVSGQLFLKLPTLEERTYKVMDVFANEEKEDEFIGAFEFKNTSTHHMSFEGFVTVENKDENLIEVKFEIITKGIEGSEFVNKRFSGEILAIRGV